MDKSIKNRKRAGLEDKYELDGCVGQGTFGMVYKAREKKNRNPVAIKMFKTTKEKEGEGISFTAVREIALLRELKHENIVSLFDVFIEPQNKSLYLVFEYAEYDLFEILKTHRERNQPIPEGAIKSFLWQLLNGIHYLHANWIIHRDLKPSNILVAGPGKDEGTTKTADFGLARLFQAPLRPLSENGVVVTIWYRAPELLLSSKHYTKAIDIWAIGCIFAELVKTQPLFPGKEKEPNNPKAFQDDQLRKIFSILGSLTPEQWPECKLLPDWSKIEHWEQFPRTLRQHMKRVSNSGYDLLSRMLEYDPNKRITAAEALDHEYFKEAPLPMKNAFAYLNGPLPYPQRQDIKAKRQDLPQGNNAR
jgi:cyclin-dependent kinase 8/11